MRLDRSAQRRIAQILQDHGQNASLIQKSAETDDVRPWATGSSDETERQIRIIPLFPETTTVLFTEVPAEKTPTTYTDHPGEIKRGDALVIDDVRWQVQNAVVYKLSGRIIFQALELFR